MSQFHPDAWVTVLVLFGILSLLAATSLPADLLMLGGLTVLLLSGVLSVSQAFAGFANDGMLTVAVLYIVVAGLRETGVVAWIATGVFGRPTTVTRAQLRMMIPVAGLSAFMNNTPLVAAMLPAVTEWGKKFGIPPSKLLMPLSFATILGGLCTLIGTSTNVIAAGLMQRSVSAGELTDGMSFFTLTWIGVPCALAGITYMAIAGRWLLPVRQATLRATDDPRAYTVEMLVAPGGPVVGKTIEQAGLRHMTDMYLAEIERNGEIIHAVGPHMKLMGGDQLVFVGVVDSVVELQKIRGLIPATNQVFKLHGRRDGRTLIEAVVSDTCPLLGKTIREGRFRTYYSAVVIAVARKGERLKGKIGDIVLEIGDTLLLEARTSFVQQQRNSRDFFLVSPLDGSAPLRHERAPVALAILIGMVLLATVFEQVPYFIERGYSTLHAALLAGGLMLLTGCCSADAVRRTVDWPVLIVIAATLGLGTALSSTGLSSEFASGLVALAGPQPLHQLAVIYIVTMLLTEVLSNTTAVVLMYPIALATSQQLGVNPLPFIVGMTIAGSCGFATPIGYQTNLMVYGPGGYKFTDYLRFGIPLNLIVCAVTLIVTPIFYPF